MTTGMSKLKNMHEGKKAREEKEREEIFDDMKSKSVTNLASNEIINNLSIIMNDREKELFIKIYDDVKDTFPDDSEKYVLATAQLAKLYVQQEMLENIINTEGMVVSGERGLYSNPAAMMLAKVQTSIITHLRQLGLTLGKKTPANKEKEVNSEFSKFK